MHTTWYNQIWTYQYHDITYIPIIDQIHQMLYPLMQATRSNLWRSGRGGEMWGGWVSWVWYFDGWIFQKFKKGEKESETAEHWLTSCFMVFSICMVSKISSKSGWKKGNPTFGDASIRKTSMHLINFGVFYAQIWTWSRVKTISSQELGCWVSLSPWNRCFMVLWHKMKPYEPTTQGFVPTI